MRANRYIIRRRRGSSLDETTTHPKVTVKEVREIDTTRFIEHRENKKLPTISTLTCWKCVRIYWMKSIALLLYDHKCSHLSHMQNPYKYEVLKKKHF